MRWFVVAVIAALIIAVTWWKTSASVNVDHRASESTVTETTGSPPPAVGSTPRGLSQPLPLGDAEVSAQEEAQRAMAQQEAARSFTAGRNKLLGRYQSEPVDQSWAHAKQSELASFATSEQIEAINAQPHNLTVACRTSVCRIGADFPSASAADDWGTLYVLGVGSGLPNASLEKTQNPDGTTHLEVYGLARQ